MKGKIDINGWLYIERAGEIKEQICPINHADINCGDWRPLFQEPYYYTDEESHIVFTVLKICKQSIFFKQLEDERGDRE
jgi:hypothetical protein